MRNQFSLWGIMQKQLSKKRGKREREERKERAKARHFRDRYRDPWLIAPEIRGWWLQWSSDWWWQRSPLVYNYYNQYVCILVCLQTHTHTHTSFDCGEIWPVISSAMKTHACRVSIWFWPVGLRYDLCFVYGAL